MLIASSSTTHKHHRKSITNPIQILSIMDLLLRYRGESPYYPALLRTAVTRPKAAVGGAVTGLWVNWLEHVWLSHDLLCRGLCPNTSCGCSVLTVFKAARMLRWLAGWLIKGKTAWLSWKIPCKATGHRDGSDSCQLSSHRIGGTHFLKPLLPWYSN